MCPLRETGSRSRSGGGRGGERGVAEAASSPGGGHLADGEIGSWEVSRPVGTGMQI